LVGACFSYNYVTGKYEPDYAMLIGFGSFVVGLVIIGFALVAGALIHRKEKEGRTHA
jgi:uncharacterized integral membrane protein